MKKILLIRHWTLFCLFLIPSLILVAVMIFSDNFTMEVSDPSFFVYAFAMVATILVFLMWSYSLGENLIRRIQSNTSFESMIFKIACLVILIFGIFAFILILSFYKRPTWTINSFIKTFLITLCITSIISYVLIAFFNAKAIKSVENNKTIRFKDFFWEFLMFLFLPIGIWILQPKINKIFKSR